MRGALKITFHDGSHEYFEVDPIGDRPDAADRLRAFVASPTVTLVLPDELLVIPGTSIREISITRKQGLPETALADIPGVITGAQRIVG